MLKKTSKTYLAALAVGLGCMSAATPAAASGFGPMNMMNPGKWFGNNNNRRDIDDLPPPGYDVPYGAPPPGYGYGALPPPGGPGYGAPPPQAPPMFNAPPGAYGAPPSDPYGGGYGNPGFSSAPSYPSTPAHAPQTYAPKGATSYSQVDQGPSRAEMEGRIQELEQRLQEMEARSRAATPAPQPTTPPPASYQYYSGDQTQGQDQTQSYPFRPMNLGK